MGLAVTTKEIMTPVKLDVYVQEKLLRDEGSQRVALMMMDISMVDVTYYFNFATGDVNPTELLEKITGPDTVVSTLTKSQEVAMAKAVSFFDLFFE